MELEELVAFTDQSTGRKEAESVGTATARGPIQTLRSSQLALYWAVPGK